MKAQRTLADDVRGGKLFVLALLPLLLAAILVASATFAIAMQAAAHFQADGGPNPAKACKRAVARHQLPQEAPTTTGKQATRIVALLQVRVDGGSSDASVHGEHLDVATTILPLKCKAHRSMTILVELLYLTSKGDATVLIHVRVAPGHVWEGENRIQLHGRASFACESHGMLILPVS